jgi:plastocyanin
MNKKEFLVVIFVLAFAVIGGILTIAMTGDKKSGETADLTNQTEVKLDINDSGYSKRAITVKKGTTVTWTNRGSIEHNVMLEHDDSGHAHDAPKANEVEPDVFAGPLLANGESYSFTFNETGTNPYHCAPHPSMQGSVTVVE